MRPVTKGTTKVYNGRPQKQNQFLSSLNMTRANPGILDLPLYFIFLTTYKVSIIMSILQIMKVRLRKHTNITVLVRCRANSWLCHTPLIFTLPIVLVSYCCCIKLIQGIKKHKFITLQFHRRKVQHSSHWANSKVLAVYSFLQSLWQNPLF